MASRVFTASMVCPVFARPKWTRPQILKVKQSGLELWNLNKPNFTKLTKMEDTERKEKRCVVVVVVIVLCMVAMVVIFSSSEGAEIEV